MSDSPAAFAEIPALADAQYVAEWVDDLDNGQVIWGRNIRGTRRTVAGAEIVIAGRQSAADSTVEWHASVREVHALDATDELDALSAEGKQGNAWPVDSTTRPCCSAIVGHAPTCPRGELSEP